VLGGNAIARELIPALQAPQSRPHCSEVFAQPWEALFDEAGRATPRPVEMVLWSGLRLAVLAATRGEAVAGAPLRDVETALIRNAVAQARGNVAAAAKALGISRATVYRKLARKPH
jgi:transcriptional regulator of acetoin/glycerol metabolism